VSGDDRGPVGLWEELLTGRLADELAGLDPGRLRADMSPLHDTEAADRLSRHLAMVVARLIDAGPPERRRQDGVALVRSVIAHLEGLVADRLSPAGDRPDPDGRVVRAVLRVLPTGGIEQVARPLTPLLDTTLLTNAPGEPALAHEVRAEIASAASIDVVMAFIRRSGIRPLTDDLRRHCQDGRRLRVLTTTYTGSTEAGALDDLVRLGADVRVSYDTETTRLHAKAWIFHRRPTSTTAYIGSSNLTHSAQVAGREWNVRVSAARNPDVVDKMAAVFESYWESADFVPYDPDDFARRNSRPLDDPVLLLSPVGVELRPFQEALLERIELQRTRGRHRNLLVAATGTGKTVMAAVDYTRLAERLPRARLLFVAHREEILTQALATFRHALRDAAFGELWVGGRRPERFDHVFASVQSLAAVGPGAFAPDHFDVVVVDEFHHAAAATYAALLDRLHPVELLGLTATPERTDGLDLLARFAGRIAAELRLWDAIDAGYLAPFDYHGIADGTDLTGVPWRRGRGYDPKALTGVLTADHAWSHLVIAAVRSVVGDPTRMRALGFCVSVGHARFMAERFEAAGISAVAVSGESPGETRRAALRDLAAGRIAAVFTVEVFNEGIDIPAVDTVLILRPTDSATIFLQQLGRGLRRSRDKPVCTVIDMVGTHRKEFRYDRRFRALLGGGRRDVERQVVEDFPYLPAGCSIRLDPVARQSILRSIRESLPTTWRARVGELRALGDVSLARYLAETGLELADVCDGARSWSELRRAAGLPTQPAGPQETALLRAVARLLHVDDPVRLGAYRRFASSLAAPAGAASRTGGPSSTDAPPGDGAAARLAVGADGRLVRMLVGQLTASTLPEGAPLEAGTAQLAAHPQVLAEVVEVLDLLGEAVEHRTEPVAALLGPPDDDAADNPLRIHARYTRTEILAAFGEGTGVRVGNWREGVRWLPDARTDLLAFTLDKTAGSFSPTTRYRDYAISPELIHWESQSTTSVSSPTGRRYLAQADGGSRVVLFARATTAARAFWCLGPATYVRHEGDRPVAIVWRLARRLPADLFTAFAAAAA
jgi:superfamily II DNA or RNA helicase/HKD family nuclease